MTTLKTFLITGANSGIGKDTARQLALLPNTKKIYLACRNAQKARQAQRDLEKQTNSHKFEIIPVDTTQPTTVKKAVHELPEAIDAVVLNAGGIGGKTPEKLTPEGVTTITASNLLGHVILVDSLIRAGKLKKTVLFASSEAARGIQQTGMKRPELSSGSAEEFTRIYDGRFFENKFDAMQVYGYIKLAGTLWMSAMARKHPEFTFLSISPGGTRGTEGMNDLPPIQRFVFKYIGMPLIMPLLGLSHSLEKGAQRFVNALNNPDLRSGKFYASKKNVLTGALVDQGALFPELEDQDLQNHAYQAIQNFAQAS